MIIIAIDCGIERTGYCIANIDNKFTLLDYNCILTLQTKTLQERLYSIEKKIISLIKKYNPQSIIAESIFFNTNQKTIINVSQSQGMILSCASRFSLPVEFLTPLQIKMIITGFGRADKKQVQKMIQLSLTIDQKITYDDTMDAIACAYAYYHLRNSKLKV